MAVSQRVYLEFSSTYDEATMCFNVLLLSSLLPKNTHGEEAVQVRATNYNDEEIILFFHIDTPKIRRDLGIQGEACDLIIYYASKKRRSICLVELKGSDIGHAVEQISNTYNHIKQRLYDAVPPDTEARSSLHKITWKACIRFSGSAPQDIKKYRDKLDRLFPKSWEIEAYRPLSRRDSNEDITSLVRR